MSTELCQQTNFNLVVAVERKLPEEPDEKIYLLPDTGFNIPLQMSNLPENPSQKEVFSWLGNTKEDILAFWQEYIKRMPLLPIKIVLDKQQGLIAPKYGGARLVDITSQEERRGSIKDSVNKIEDFLLGAKPCSVAILTSPPGWSGLVNENGLPIYYQDTQTSIFYKDTFGNIQAFTLVSHLDLNDNQNLIYNFSGKETDNNLLTTEKIIDVTSSPLLFESTEEYGFNLEGVLTAIYTLNPNAFNLEEAANLINNLDNLEAIVDFDCINKQITNFENGVRELLDEGGSEFNDRVAKLLGLTILETAKWARILEEGGSEVYIPIYHRPNNLDSSEINYQRELRYLQSKGGCNGGGKLTLGISTIETVLGQRNVAIAEKGPSRFCYTCNQEVKTYVVNGIVYCSLCHEPLGIATDND